MKEDDQNKQNRRLNEGPIKVHMLKDGFYVDPREVLASKEAHEQIRELNRIYGHLIKKK